MYERMSMDELAAYEADNGSRLYRDNGLWWQEVRPYFWRPLFPFRRVEADAVRIPLHRRLIGCQHLVGDERLANSRMNFIMIDEPGNYSPGYLPAKLRRLIRDAERHSEVRAVTDPAEFATSAYPVYLSFYRRTLYGWRKDRTDRKKFQQWTAMLYRHPKLKILGCYARGTLNTVMISYFVEDVIFYATLFCTDEALKLHTSDLMLHKVREMAAQCPGAKYIYLGAAGARRGLDAFKLKRKCRLVSEPARFKLNPPAAFIMKRFLPIHYRRLKGELVYYDDERLKGGRREGFGERESFTSKGILSRYGKPGRVYGSK